MADRIYVTYTPAGIPGCFHTAIHFQRTGPAGDVIKHFVIEARPGIKDLTAPEKAIGVVEEAFRKGGGPSRFGNIRADVRDRKASHVTTEASDDPNAPYETIAEGDDLSENFARMQLYASGFNRAGFAYRGDRQNSNTFASGALLAGKLPSPTGVAHDPTGRPGELLEFFAPGLNEPLGHPSDERAPSPVLLELQKYWRPAARVGATERATPLFGQIDATSAGEASWSRPTSPVSFGSPRPGQGSAFADGSEDAQGDAKPDTYRRLRSRLLTSAFPGITPGDRTSQCRRRNPRRCLGFSAKPTSPGAAPRRELPDNSDAPGESKWLTRLASSATKIRDRGCGGAAE
jgi:hypothetical protein